MLSDLRRRVSILWREKLILSVALPLYFCTFYFALQRFVLVTPHQLAPSLIDDLIPFSPGWTAVYQSLYLLLPVPWLCTSPNELRRYRIGFFAMTAVAFAVFLIAPVAGPRPATPADHDLYKLLITYDANLNAFPSLHVGLTVLAFLLVRSLTRSTALTAVALVWAALIVYSTMAVKQHWAADVAAGLALALAADLFARSIVQRKKENLYAPTSRWIDPPDAPGREPGRIR